MTVNYSHIHDHEAVDYLTKRCTEDPATGCWNWNLSVYANTGYGQVGSRKLIERSGKVAAHTLSYWAHHGPYEDGKLILHSCANRRCLNPDHLRTGTHRDNWWDMVEHGRYRSGAQRFTDDQIEAMKELFVIPGVTGKLIGRLALCDKGYPSLLVRKGRKGPPTIH